MFTTVLVAILTAATPPQDLGALSFPVTGNAECKTQFARGALALHSFEYEVAHEAFRAAVKADPKCAMAYWGDAMAYNHPLWGEDWADDARKALGHIDNESSLTTAEQAHIRAARALFGNGSLHDRHAAWLAEAQRNAKAAPQDDELQLQYALALIANSERYTNTRRLMEAAAITMDVFARKPTHPGAAHYFIHACDTPDHAVLALPAARVYARIAPAAPHARHMPSHIFVQLGMWREAAASNEDSWAALLERYKAHGNEGSPDFHSISWLGAAYLELGRVREARAIIDDLATRLQQRDDGTARWGYASLVRKYLTDTNRWSETKDLYTVMKDPFRESGEAADSLGCAMHVPGASTTAGVRPPFGIEARAVMQLAFAEAAMHAGNVKEAQTHLNERRTTLAAMKPWGSLVAADLVQRTQKQDAAVLAAAKAYNDKSAASWAQAISAAKAWAALQDAKPIQGPAFDPPGALLVADLELNAGRAKEAAATYESVLTCNVNLSRAMLGLARAAKAAGNATLSSDRYAMLAQQWSSGDADRDDVREVKAAAGALEASRPMPATAR